MNTLIKNLIIAMLGGNGYCLIEIIYRGRTHYSMYIAGAIILVVFYNFNRLMELPLFYKCIFGAIFITFVELMIGLIFNRDFSVWNYSNMPLNIGGQICVPFTLIWFAFSGVIFFILEKIEQYSEKALI